MTCCNHHAKDIEAGIHCESYVSNPLDEPGDRCRKSHKACMGKLCKDYWPAERDAMTEPLPCDYRPRTITNEYGELRIIGDE